MLRLFCFVQAQVHSFKEEHVRGASFANKTLLGHGTIYDVAKALGMSYDTDKELVDAIAEEIPHDMDWDTSKIPQSRLAFRFQGPGSHSLLSTSECLATFLVPSGTLGSL